MTDQEAAGYFQRADVVALPYLRSSASGPLAIAQACGLPVVVTSVGGLVEAAVTIPERFWSDLAALMTLPEGCWPQLICAVACMRCQSPGRLWRSRMRTSSLPWCARRTGCRDDETQARTPGETQLSLAPCSWRRQPVSRVGQMFQSLSSRGAATRRRRVGPRHP